MTFTFSLKLSWHGGGCNVARVGDADGVAVDRQVRHRDRLEELMVGSPKGSLFAVSGVILYIVPETSSTSI